MDKLILATSVNLSEDTPTNVTKKTSKANRNQIQHQPQTFMPTVTTLTGHNASRRRQRIPSIPDAIFKERYQIDSHHTAEDEVCSRSGGGFQGPNLVGGGAI